MPKALGFLLIAVVVVGCSWPTLVCGCSPPPRAVGTVFGTVTAAAGGPALGALVSVQARLHDCDVALPLIDQSSDRPIDAVGRYSLPVWGPGGDAVGDTVCLRVVARRANSGPGLDSAVAVGIRLRVSWPPFDSVRVDLQLP